MSNTIVFKNAHILVSGYDLSAELHTLNVTYSAAMLDRTVFGMDTKTNVGGLYDAGISGEGFGDFSKNVGSLMFTDLGVDDYIITVFPDGITEGSAFAGSGYAMKGTNKTFTMGGTVGGLDTIKFDFAARGIGA